MADTLDVERNNAQGSIECPNPWKQRAEAAERICQGNGKIGEALEMLKVVQERDRLAAQRAICLLRVSELNDENAALRAQLDAVERYVDMLDQTSAEVNSPTIACIVTHLRKHLTSTAPTKEEP